MVLSYVLYQRHYEKEESEELEEQEDEEHFEFCYVLFQSATKIEASNKTPNPIPNATNPKVFKEMIEVNSK
jgi:hypothetical protein